MAANVQPRRRRRRHDGRADVTGRIAERAPHEREWGTAAAVTASVLFGAHIVRVHGVREMVDVVRVSDRILAADTAASTAAKDAG